MELDNALEALESVGQPRGFENYYLAFFGEPSTTAPWAWRTAQTGRVPIFYADFDIDLSHVSVPPPT